MNQTVVTQWETPTFEEITVSCEINSYTNADL